MPHYGELISFHHIIGYTGVVQVQFEPDLLKVDQEVLVEKDLTAEASVKWFS